MEWYEMIDYDQAKNFIATSIKDIARSFVKIGYYLKYIKEKELYKEDGYQDIWEFAFDTYGISRSTASRYIAINDRFSEHGNSPVLAAALLQKEVAAVFKGIGEIAKGISEVFLGAAEYFSQTQQEDNPVVLTKALAERRKQGCRTRKYKVYKK